MRSAFLVAGLALSACAATTPPPESGAPARTCHGESLGRFVGQPATQQLGADVMQASGARTLRWVAHDMMVTMEFSPDRVTVWLNRENRVERANCG